MKLVHWPLMGGLLHLVQRGGDWAVRSPPRPILAVPNVTAHPSTASVPITVSVLPYSDPLLCRFSVSIKGLNVRSQTRWKVINWCKPRWVEWDAAAVKRCESSVDGQLTLSLRPVCWRTNSRRCLADTGYDGKFLPIKLHSFTTTTATIASQNHQHRYTVFRKEHPHISIFTPSRLHLRSTSSASVFLRNFSLASIYLDVYRQW